MQRINSASFYLILSFDVTDLMLFRPVAANSARLALAMDAIPPPAGGEFTAWMLGQSHLDIAWFWRTARPIAKRSARSPRCCDTWSFTRSTAS